MGIANEVSKVCKKCGESKPIDQFSWQKKSVTRQARCKSCMNEYHRIWRNVNRGHLKEYHTKNIDKKRKCDRDYTALHRVEKRTYRDKTRQAKKDYIISLFPNYVCSICGESDPEVLVHHHLGDKVERIARMLTGGYTLEDIAEELKKCIILCRNCHKLLHLPYKVPNRIPTSRIVRNWRYRDEYLDTHICPCGESRKGCLEFHHVRGKKVMEIGAMLSYKVSLGELREEMDKCDVLCSNCHQRVSNRDRRQPDSEPVF
jgi:hypothetical protein